MIQWFNLIANSSDVVVSGLNLSAVWSTGEETPNSDGWDVYRSDSVVIQNSIINNGDDCVSFKPNSTNIVVQVSGDRVTSLSKTPSQPEPRLIADVLCASRIFTATAPTESRLALLVNT